jgi:hypothetical protein
MGKLLTLSLVLATLGLTPGTRAGDEAPPPARAEAPASTTPAPGAKKAAPAKKSAKKGAKAAKGKDAKPSDTRGAGAETKPCEPVKPCPID